MYNKQPHDSICILDIETIPDIEAAINVCPDLKKDATPEEKAKALQEYHLKITDGKNDFLRQPFHQIICISFVFASIEQSIDGEYYKIKKIGSYSAIDKTEKEIVQAFLNAMAKSRTRIVSFNGKNFDIPVIKYRALKYNLPMKWFFQSGDKWNSYASRYSKDWHCDLLDTLSDYGSSARIKMSEICAILDIPCKTNMDGSSVWPEYLLGNIKDIVKYCEEDVVITYMIYLRYMTQTGDLLPESYHSIIEELAEFINDNAEHLKSIIK